MAADYVITREHHAFTLDAALPSVLDVSAPCTITFETGDFAYRRLARGERLEEIGLQNFNAVTGPVSIHGAEPGHVLCIEVLDIEVESAWSVWIPGMGQWGDKTTELQRRQVLLEDGWAIINERIRVPIEPMIGCIGVAPALGRGSTLSPAYPWGGNMDLREMSAGAILYLPVQVPGALLFIGDLHAAMGSAEPTSVSLEAAGSATVRVTVEKDRSLQAPRLRVGTETLFVGIADSFERARYSAMDQAYAYLTDEIGLSPFDAYTYASARVGLRLGGPASAIVLAVVPDIDN